MSDDGIKTGKSTSKGKNKAGSKKELKPAQVEVELVEQVDSQNFLKDSNLIFREIQTNDKVDFLEMMKRYLYQRTETHN